MGTAVITYNISDSTKVKNYEKKKKSQLWKKSSKFSLSINEGEKEDKKNWKKNDNSAKNDSTLSLHIEAYENLVEANLFGDKIGETLKSYDSTKNGKNTKQIIFPDLAMIIQNPFEFPRQQNIHVSEPEVSTFKASQRLLNRKQSNNQGSNGTVAAAQNVYEEIGKLCAGAAIPFALTMLRNRGFTKSAQTSFLISRRSLSSYKSDEYQFLHKSTIPTYHFQKSLRRLPIPKLEDSARRYLNAAKAVVSDAEFKETEAAVKQLLGKSGQELQKELLAYDAQNKHTSYISEPWFDMYLKSRLPCPVNYNPFMMFAPEKDASYNDQLSRATNFAISCARFKKSLDAEILAPEVFHLNPKKSDTDFFRTVCRLLPSNLSWFGAIAFKAFPLDMSQYPSLFGGNRIPARNKDILHNCKNPKHFMVMSKGNIYAVDLFDEQGNILPPENVHASLAKILKSSSAPETNICVGSLTTLERDTWADIRNELISNSKNHASFRSIDDALFVLCLDDLKTEDHARLVQSLLCGDDGHNRWFDKCFQLIIDGNGQATINFEHSWGDGVAVLRLMEETLLDTSTHHFVKPNQTVSGDPKVQKLEFEISDSLKNKIKKAQEDHIDRCKDLQFATVEYTNMTRDTIKSYKLSPDSVMQLAIQLAFYKAYNEFAPTYESCSTAAYKKGRTECVRSATIATRDTVLAIEGKKPGNIKDLMKQCSDVHYQLCKEASMGQGFDRHLLGIKMTAERLGRPIPELFFDKTYNYMGQFVLSTSTLSTDTIVFGGFGPVVPNGFGIGYNVAGSKMGCVISSYRSKRDAAKFVNAIAESLDTIHHHLKN